MLNNDVLRSVRFSLDASDAKVAEIIRLSGGEVDKDEVTAWLKKDNEDGYRECSDELLAHFLNGLVLFLRGPDENRPLRPIELPVTNNLVLKKLRVAFDLQEDDMHAILKAAGFAVSKPELNAVFRKPGSKNYRACGDQLLRNFLKGLSETRRGPKPARPNPADRSSGSPPAGTTS
jgi:uncharacterized protein YehS (DUF1456 family)